jgi:hypothetical protein
MRQVTRRSFLKGVSAAGCLSPLVFSSTSLSRAGGRKLRHACIGTGGQGFSDLKAMASHADIEYVAFCDVDAERRAKAAELFPQARTYSDWRELLEKENDRIDSVTVSTPDHMHAPITLTALRQGKHVYCQKPLCHDIAECRAVAEEAARRPQQVTQMGIQIHSHIAYRTAVAMIQYGMIGKIKEVHSWCGKGWVGPPETRPTHSDPVPKSLNWDLWLGNAPERPYVSKIYHPGNWRRWLDFGTGTQGDMAAHIMDPIFTALKLTSPLDIQSEGTAPYAETYSPKNRITYRFPGTAYTTGDSILYHWCDAGLTPDFSAWPLPVNPQTGETKPPMQGSMFVGEKGYLLLPHIGGPQPLPRARFAEDLRQFKKDVELPKIESHYHQFISAALGPGSTSVPFSYGGSLSESVVMGAIANRFPKQKLIWDAQALQFTNVPEANAFLRRTYRAGWEVEGLG